MHLQRILTAIVAIPALILLIAMGNDLSFAILILVVSFISLYEYFNIVFNNSSQSKTGLIPAVGYLTIPFIVFAAYHRLFPVVVVTISINILMCGFASFKQFKTDTSVLDAVSRQIQGIIYIPVILSFLVLIRMGEDGNTWIYLILLIVAAGDTGAYYAGTYFGKNKLIPWVSPKKTIEGFIGGLVLTIIAGSVYKYYTLPDLLWPQTILFFFCIGIAGPSGDLFESMLKRVGGIKDSGAILPGHGGLLDRIDALLFATPVMFLFKEYIL